MKDPGDNGKPQLGFFLQNFGKCLWPLARLTSFGANSKYKPFDWRTRDNQYFIDKLTRHFLQFIDDPTAKDEETNELHIVAVAFHALCLIYKITQAEQEAPLDFDNWASQNQDVPLDYQEEEYNKYLQHYEPIESASESGPSSFSEWEQCISPEWAYSGLSKEELYETYCESFNEGTNTGGNEDDLPNEPMSFEEWAKDGDWAENDGWWWRREWKVETSNCVSESHVRNLYQEYLKDPSSTKPQRVAAD